MGLQWVINESYVQTRFASTNCYVLIVLSGSVFKSGWRDCPENWHSPQLASEFLALRQVRDVCNKSLDLARSDQVIGSALEAKLTITTNSSRLAVLVSEMFVQRGAEGEANYSLADFLTVSEAVVAHCLEGALGEPSPHTAEGSVNLNGTTGSSVHVSVRKAELHKCPRCWRHLAASSGDLCKRCDSVVAKQQL